MAIGYSFTPAPICPRFPLPPALMYHVGDNYSASLYLKLIKTCKYFYYIRPVIVIEGIELIRHNCCLESCFGIQYSSNYLFPAWLKIKELISDPNNPNKPKLWITKRLDVGGGHERFTLPFLIPHIYRADIEYLVIFCQELTFTDFRFLLRSQMVKYADLYRNKILHKNGTIVSVQELMNEMPNNILINITLENLKFSAEPSFSKMPKFEHLAQLTLRGCDDSLDIQAFAEFIKKLPNLINLMISFTPAYEDLRFPLFEALESLFVTKSLHRDGISLSQDPSGEYYITC